MIRNALRRFMYGRYGGDTLNLSLIGLYLLLYLLFALSGASAFYWLSFLPIFAAVYRCLSRDIPRRQMENVKFLSAVRPFLQWLRLRRTIRRDKDHRYFKCPNCGQQLRVPRGKGTITVTCRRCGAVFQEKS